MKKNIFIISILLCFSFNLTVDAEVFQHLDSWDVYDTARMPSGLAILPPNNDIVVSAGGGTTHDKIVVFNSTGAVVRSFGAHGTGNGEFNWPAYVAVGGKENSIWVTDCFNNRLQTFSSTGGFLSTFGNLGNNNEEFNQPRGIAFNGLDRYVTDSKNYRVKKYYWNLFEWAITNWGELGPFDGQFGNPIGAMNTPMGGIDIKGTNVFVVDGANWRVQVFDLNGNFLRKWGTGGIEYGEFYGPLGLRVDVSNRVWVTEKANERVQVFTDTGEFLFALDDSSVFESPSEPYDVEFHPDGTVYVSDLTGSKIHRFVDGKPYFVTGTNFWTYEQEEISFAVIAEDRNNNNLFYEMISGPSGATFSEVNGTNYFVWTPGAEDGGTFSSNFVAKFRVFDDGVPVATNEQIVQITVYNTNHVPTISHNLTQPLTVNEGQAVSFNVTVGDSDDDNLSLVYNVPTGCSVSQQSATEYLVNWTPDYTQGNSPPITYSLNFWAVDDGIPTQSNSCSAQIDVMNVNNPPEVYAVPAPVLYGFENQNFTVDVFATDPDGVTVTTNHHFPDSTFVQLNSTNWQWAWTPGLTDAGEYTNFAFFATDGHAFPATTIFSYPVIVSNVNRAPVWFPPTALTIDEGKTTNFLVRLFDIDTDDEIVLVSTQSLSGMVWNFLGQTVTSTGQYNNWEIDWPVGYDQSGSTNLEWIASDGVGGFATTVWNITVNEINDPPILGALTNWTIGEGELLQFPLLATDANDDILVFSISNAPPEAVVTNFIGTNYFYWLADYNVARTSSFAIFEIFITVTEQNAFGWSDSGSFELIVTNVNRAPTVFVPPDAATPEGELWQGDFAVFDPDTDDVMQITFEGVPSGWNWTSSNSTATATGQWWNATAEWTPNYNQSGVYAINLTADDGRETTFSIVSNKVEITVIDTNAAPIVTGIINTNIPALENFSEIWIATDPNDDEIFLSLENAPAGSIFNFENGTGTFSWTPTLDDYGYHSNITIRAWDSSGQSGTNEYIWIVRVTLPEYAWNEYEFFDVLPKDSRMLLEPAGVATLNGKIYITDSIRKAVDIYEADGEFVESWDLSTLTGNPLAPSAIAIADNTVYIADEDNDCIYLIDTEGNYKTTWGSSGTGPLQFDYPSGIEVHNGMVYVSDRGNSRIQKIRTDGLFILEWGTYGSEDGEFDNPMGIVVTPDHKVFVADSDNYRIQYFDTLGNYLGEFDGSPEEFSSDCVDIAVTDDEKLFVLDAENGRISQFVSTGIFVSSFVFTANGKDIVGAVAMTTDSDNSLWIADTENRRVVAANESGNLKNEITGSGFGQISGPVESIINNKGIHILDTTLGRIQLLDPAGNFNERFGAIGADYGELYNPLSFAVAADGRYFIADSGIGRVQIWSSEGKSLASWYCVNPVAVAYLEINNEVVVVSGTGEFAERYNTNGVILGSFGNSGSGDGEFVSPSAIFVDNGGKIFVADATRIQEFSITGGYVKTACSLDVPVSGIACDELGQWIVSEPGYSGIAVYDSAGNFVNTGGGIGSEEGQFSEIGKLTIREGTLTIADKGNSRIQAWRRPGIWAQWMKDSKVIMAPGTTNDLTIVLKNMLPFFWPEVNVNIESMNAKIAILGNELIVSNLNASEKVYSTDDWTIVVAPYTAINSGYDLICVCSFADIVWTSHLSLIVKELPSIEWEQSGLAMRLLSGGVTNISVSVTNNGSEKVSLNFVTGEYRWAEIPFEWEGSSIPAVQMLTEIDVISLEELTKVGKTEKLAWQPINLPFNFPYDGNSYSTIYAREDGSIRIGSDEESSPRIDIFADDLTLENGEMSIETNKYFCVITYSNIRRTTGTEFFTFQAVFYNDGSVQCNYYSMNGLTTKGHIGRRAGATILDTCALKNSEGINKRSFRLCPPIGWMNPTPQSLSILPGKSDTINFEITSPGTYNMLRNAISPATNNPGWALPIMISDLSPVEADFIANPLVGEPPLIVIFSDLSSYEPQYWFWDFNGNEKTDSNVQNPTNTYLDGGFYSVVLTVSNDFGSGLWSKDTASRTNYIEVIPEPAILLFLYSAVGLLFIFRKNKCQ